MNREQRRKFNKQNKTHYTREEFAQMEILQALRSGDLDITGFEPDQLPEGFHIDNEELIPEGRETKLAYDNIMSRQKKDYSKEFLAWVETHKDEIMHVTREEAQNSLVCLKEDVKTVKENFTDEDHHIGHIPWLFDIWSDLLFEHPETHEWVFAGQL